jgi:hypothetical protein
VINSMHPLVSGPGATERSPLVDQLARKVDTNRDGEVTSAEFSSFLSSLMQSLDHDLVTDRSATPTGASGVTASPARLHTGDAGAMTPAQAATLLRQAFEPTTRSR